MELTRTHVGSLQGYNFGLQVHDNLSKPETWSTGDQAPSRSTSPADTGAVYLRILTSSRLVYLSTTVKKGSLLAGTTRTGVREKKSFSC